MPKNARSILPVLLASATVSFVACSGTEDDVDVRPFNPPGQDGGPAVDAGPGQEDGSVGGGDGGGGGVNPVANQCRAEKAGTKGRVFQGTLLLPDSAKKGEIFIDDAGLIACAAADCKSTPGYADASIYACDDAVISPGLINPHEHISFANNAPKVHGTERYEHRHDWRKGIRGHTRIAVQGGASDDVILFAELRFMMGGATSIAGAGGADGLMRNLDASPSQLEGLPIRPVDSDTFPLKDSGNNPPMSTSGCGTYPSSRRTAASIEKLDGYLPHISEGIDAETRNEFVCQSSGVNDLVQKQTAIIHGIAVRAEDVALYRADQTALVWSPRSNVDLYGDTAPVTLYHRGGVQIALGTDWIASGSMNLLRELRCADDLNRTYFAKTFTDQELWRMVTINAAFATGTHKFMGALKPGYVGDIAIYNARANKDYRAVVAASVEDVLLVVRGGKPMYGNADVMDLPGIDGTNCETLDVCGVAKKACVSDDTSNKTSLEKIRKAGEAIYPLFFCRDKVPTDEPSCVPWRQSYASGIGASDKDGDGVNDLDDNCPSIFNPKRPVDDNKQLDSDDDGKGDACDNCPLETDEVCTPPDPNDIDGDGVSNGADNCPELANQDQADVDTDGKGDACDDCTDPNPGVVLCTKAMDIAVVRDPQAPGHPTAGSARVIVSDVYVTGVRSTGSDRGFFVQANRTAPYNGLFVATRGTTPSVVVGNKVTVTGTYEEVFGVTMLTSPQIKVDDPSTTLPFGPIRFTATELGNSGRNAEPFESMLVIVENVEVTNINPDAPKDFDEFSITQTMRVDDYLYDAMDNAYPLALKFQSITGVAGFTFGNRKLYPRSEADLKVAP
jgi:hypothetical protein